MLQEVGLVCLGSWRLCFWVVHIVEPRAQPSAAHSRRATLPLPIGGEAPSPSPCSGEGGISVDLRVRMGVIDMVALPCVKCDVWVCVQVHQGGGIYDVYY